MKKFLFSTKNQIVNILQDLIFFQRILTVIKRPNWNYYKNSQYSPPQASSYFILREFVIPTLKHTKFKTFVDLGCGFGRVLLFVFLKLKSMNLNLIGLDIDEKVCQTAQKNIGKRAISIYNTDVLKFNFNFENPVFFIFNSFPIPVLIKVLDKLSQLENPKIIFWGHNKDKIKYFSKFKYYEVVDLEIPGYDEVYIIYINFNH